MSCVAEYLSLDSTTVKIRQGKVSYKLEKLFEYLKAVSGFQKEPFGFGSKSLLDIQKCNSDFSSQCFTCQILDIVSDIQKAFWIWYDAFNPKNHLNLGICFEIKTLYIKWLVYWGRTQSEKLAITALENCFSLKTLFILYMYMFIMS